MIPPETRVRPPRRYRLVLLGALLCLLAFAAGAVWWAILPASAVSGSAQRVFIPPGSTVEEVGRLLYEKGLIRTPLAFRALAQWTGADRKIRSGEYDLDPRMSVREILRHLVRGDVVTYPFTVPEGYTVEQVAALLSEKGLADRTRFLEVASRPELAPFPIPHPERVRYPLEGYLFPDTYRVPRGMSEEELVSIMVRRFDQVFTPEMKEKAIRLGLSGHELITLASIVERETGVAEERPLVAGVFWNRLRRGMPLQADPTVAYAVGRPGNELTRRDLSVESPYNTYRYGGLPPGPIANPGLAAIRAVLEPADTDYLYFVARGDGSHEFSRTLSEHLRAVSRYRNAR